MERGDPAMKAASVGGNRKVSSVLICRIVCYLTATNCSSSIKDGWAGRAPKMYAWDLSPRKWAPAIVSKPMVFIANNRTAEQHVVIAGAGRVGNRTARVLHDYGHTVCLVERDPAAAERATDLQTGVVIEGDATDPQILRQTGFEDADILAALTGDGPTNFAICAEMRHLTDDIRTVTRVADPDHANSAQEFVDETVYPERAGSKAAVNRVQGDDVRALKDIAGDIDVLNIRVAPGSPVAGKQLREILLPDGSHIISDAAGTEIARPDTTLEPGRRYLVAAEPNTADDVHKLLIG